MQEETRKLLIPGLLDAKKKAAALYEFIEELLDQVPQGEQKGEVVYDIRNAQLDIQKTVNSLIRLREQLLKGGWQVVQAYIEAWHDARLDEGEPVAGVEYERFEYLGGDRWFVIINTPARGRE